jgi:hypothetical protein
MLALTCLIVPQAIRAGVYRREQTSSRGTWRGVDLHGAWRDEGGRRSTRQKMRNPSLATQTEVVSV